jgi:hypothetical protein
VAPHLDEGSEDPTTTNSMQQRHRKEKQAAKVDEGGMVCVSGIGHIQMWQPLYKWAFLL